MCSGTSTNSSTLKLLPLADRNGRWWIKISKSRENALFGLHAGSASGLFRWVYKRKVKFLVAPVHTGVFVLAQYVFTSSLTIEIESTFPVAQEVQPKERIATPFEVPVYVEWGGELACSIVSEPLVRLQPAPSDVLAERTPNLAP